MPEQPEPPGWLVRLLEAIGEFLAPIGRAFGMSWPVFKWVLLAFAIALLAYLLWRLLAPLFSLERARPEREEQLWSPDRFEERRARAREKVRQHRQLLGTGRRTPVGTGWRVASTGVFGEIRSTMEDRFAVATDAAGSLPAKPEKTER